MGKRYRKIYLDMRGGEVKHIKCLNLYPLVYAYSLFRTSFFSELVFLVESN